MFERQTRQPFPATNIMLMALVVVAFLVYLLKNLQRPATAPIPPEVTAPAIDSTGNGVRIDSVVR